MPKPRLTAVLAVALGLAALQVAVAGPAAADHAVDVAVDGSSCTKGLIAFGIPIRLESDRAVVRTLRNGNIQARCHLRGLPDRIVHEELGTWVRPSRATRIPPLTICSLHGEGLDMVFGFGEALVTPAGTLKVTCTFRPPFGPPA